MDTKIDEKLLNEKMAQIREQVIQQKLVKFESRIKPIFISWIVSSAVLFLLLSFTSITNQYTSYLMFILAVYVYGIPSVLTVYLLVKGVKRLVR